MDRLLTLQEVAKMMGVHPITIKRKVWKKELPCVVVGKLYRFDESAIKAYLASNTVEVEKNDNETIR